MKKRLFHIHKYVLANGELPPGWCVVHVDGDRSNDCVSNLAGAPTPLRYRLYQRMQMGERFTKAEIERLAKGYADKIYNERFQCWR